MPSSYSSFGDIPFELITGDIPFELITGDIPLSAIGAAIAIPCMRVVASRVMTERRVGVFILEVRFGVVCGYG